MICIRFPSGENGGGDGSVARSTCARNVWMQMGTRAVRLQCTSWTSMTVKSTHAHYEMYCANLCHKNSANYKVQKSCRFKKWLLICGTKPREGCSQCQALPLILLITSPLTYGLPGTSHERSSTSPIERSLSITRELGNM